MDRPYLLAAIAALALLLLISLGLNAWQWRGAAITRTEQEGELKVCSQANARAAGVRTELQAALDACVGQQRDLTAQMSVALSQRDAELGAAQARQRQLSNQLEKTYATDAACRSWRDLPVCRAVSDRLRESANDQRP